MDPATSQIAEFLAAMPAVIKAFLSGLSPLVHFLLLLSIFLVVPSISKRLRIPGLVGLILAGILLGSGGIDIWPDRRPLLGTFAEVGKLLLLFYAGMELDIDVLRRSSIRALAFGLSTLLLPLLGGIALGSALGHGMVASLMIGAIVASHTMLGYPVVQRLGLAGLESVTITVAGTIFTETVALLILAVCTSTHTDGFTLPLLAMKVGAVLAYSALVIFLAMQVAQRVLHGRESEEDIQVLVILAIMLVAALLAHAFGLEPIIGAFLSGVAVSRALRNSIAKQHIEVLGNTLFVPAFFFVIGLSLDTGRISDTLVQHWQLPAALLATVLLTKFAAAWLCGAAFRYEPAERMVMWSLTVPHVVATLAMTVVAQESLNAAGQPLLSQSFGDAVLVLLVVTATLGPVITGYYAGRLSRG